MNRSFKVALRYAGSITIALIGYFLILKLFDLHENPWLRIFNGAAMCVGIYFAIKYYKLTSGDNFSYINGIKTGLITGFITTILFTVFMAIYMFHLDVEFTQKLLGDWFSDYKVGANILIFIVFIEGMASTVVLSLAFMQLFKKSNNVPQKT
ncbi:MAG: DUF4199 domain-containing protein [Psychroserpens sp.]|uniref:DUF4199 domain-containing protein n=1 Tax=Psychroserpens sp. TaxID=2020870 RepID=UPI003C785F21